MNDISNLPVEEQLTRAAQSIEPRPDFENALWQKMIETPRLSRTPFSIKRFFARPMSAAAACLLGLAVLGLIAAGPRNVMALIDRLLVYLPGIGFVQNDEKTLYLSSPLTVEKDGISITIEQAVADAKNTIIAYRIDNLPPGNDCVYDGNKLLFADGKTRLPIGGGLNGNHARIEFFPMPAGEKKAVLLISRDQNAQACTAPLTWEIEIPFGPVPADAPLLPVTRNTESKLLSVTPADISNPDQKTGKIHFTLDHSVELPYGYLLSGKVTWDGFKWGNAGVSPENIRVTDAAGVNIPVEPNDEGTKNNEIIFKLKGKGFKNPLTVQFLALTVLEMHNPVATFTFDAGKNPQVGQTWKLDKKIEIEGFPVTIQTISVIRGDDVNGSNYKNIGFKLDYTINPAIHNLIWICHGKDQSEIAGMEGRRIDDHQYSSSIYYPQGLPEGLVTCEMADMSFQYNGPWSILTDLP